MRDTRYFKLTTLGVFLLSSTLSLSLFLNLFRCEDQLLSSDKEMEDKVREMENLKKEKISADNKLVR